MAKIVLQEDESLNPSEKHFDKEKIPPKILERYQKFAEKGTPIKTMVSRLSLESIEGLIKYPQYIIDGGDEDEWEDRVAEYIIKNVLPSMVGKTEEAQATGRTQKAELINDFLNTLDVKKRGIFLTSGKKIGFNELSSKDFSASGINIEKLKLMKKDKELFDIRGAKDKFNLYRVSKALDRLTLKNMEELINFIDDKLTKVKEGEELGLMTTFKFVDIPTEGIFSNKMISDINQRKATYQYWKKIHEKFGEVDDENSLMGKLKQLSALLPTEEKGNLSPKQRIFVDDSKKFVKQMQKIKDLNYITQTKTKSIKVKDAEETAFLFIEKFFQKHHGISSLFDTDDVDIVYEQVITEDGQSKDMSGVDVKETESPDKIEQEIENYDDVVLDPLALKYFREDLNEMAELYSDLQSTVLEEIRNQLPEYRVFLSRPEDYEKIREGLEDTIEAIESFTSDEIYLPIFIFNLPSLSREYRDEAAEANDIQEDIFDFLEAYSDLLEDEKTMAAVNVNLMLRGIGSESKGIPTALERYKKFEGTKIGEVRKFRKEVKKLIDEINDLILELFVKPMHSIHRFGMSLPFEKSTQLRTIVGSSKNIGDDFLAYKEITERIKKTDTAFIGEIQARKMLEFLQSITRGEIFEKPLVSQSKAREFVNSIAPIFNKNKKVREQLKKEVSSLFGALVSVSKEKKDIPNVYPNIDIKEQYQKERVDDPKEILALQVLTNAIREKKNTISTSGGGDIPDSLLDSLLSELDRVAKSELYSKLIDAHDSLRILKGKRLHYGKRNENNFEHVEDMLNKMQVEHDLDMSASELVSIVNEIDSFNNISKNYGISQEQVYIIKANFR